ncbi:putative DNA-binding protein [Bradyrhizobium sp. LB1.3]
MANSTKIVGTRIKRDLEERMKELAARERRTVSDWIRCRLEDAVAAASQPIQHRNEAA